MFERTITMRDIAEPLVSFDEDIGAEAVRRLMEQRDFHVVGVRSKGAVHGYVRRGDLKDKVLKDHLLPFDSSSVCADTDPLIGVFRLLKTHDRAFVNVFGAVGGIVTRGDLQKAPVRMWIFGLVSLLEMHMLRLIRERHPDGSWAEHLTPGRLQKSKKLFTERERRNQAIDLSDCLQMADKGAVFLKNPDLFKILQTTSRQKAQAFFARVEDLRNRLAHSQDILSGNWPSLADLLVEIENVLRRMEKA
jgi:hypothetical protein